MSESFLRSLDAKSLDAKKTFRYNLSAEEYQALLGNTAPGRSGFQEKKRRGKTIFSRHHSALQNLQQPKDALTALPFEVSLPFLPPSVNRLFLTVKDNQTGRTKRVLTQKARKVREKIAFFVQGQLSTQELYELHLQIEFPVFTKAGTIRKLDLTNRVKFLEDCVSSCLGIDDRQFFRVVLHKVQAEQERTLIRILPYSDFPESSKKITRRNQK